MTLQPMPIHVRIFPGETVDSFARRAATANHTTITDIEAGLRHYGLLISRARSSDQRACLWRQLGALPPHAFSTPKTFNNHPVPARTLCRHCANGDTVIARMPHLGMICLRHGCTLQPPHTPIDHLPAILHAERRFRHLHRTRGLVMDSPAMNIARDTALLAYDPGRDPILPSPEIIVYRPQVTIAAMITDPTFLETVCSTTRPAPQRRHYTGTRLARATGVGLDHIGKALQYMWNIIDNLDDYIRATRAGHRSFTDTAHDLLPYHRGTLDYSSAGSSLVLSYGLKQIRPMNWLAR